MAQGKEVLSEFRDLCHSPRDMRSSLEIHVPRTPHPTQNWGQNWEMMKGLSLHLSDDSPISDLMGEKKKKKETLRDDYDLLKHMQSVVASAASVVNITCFVFSGCDNKFCRKINTYLFWKRTIKVDHTNLLANRLLLNSWIKNHLLSHK